MMKGGKKRVRKSQEEEDEVKKVTKKGKKKNLREEEDCGKAISRAIRSAAADERRAAGKKGMKAAKRRRLDSEEYKDSVLGMPEQDVLTETRYGISSEAAPTRKLNVADLTAAAVLDEEAGGQAMTELRTRLQNIERKIAEEKLGEDGVGPKALQKPDETVEVERKDRVKKYKKQRTALSRRWGKVVAANSEAEHVTFPLKNDDVQEFTVSTTHGLSSRASMEPQNALEGRIRELLSTSGVDNKSVAKYERELRSKGVEAMDALLQQTREARDDDELDEGEEEEDHQEQQQQQQDGDAKGAKGTGQTPVKQQQQQERKKEKGKKKRKQLTPEEEEERKMSMRLYYQQLKNMRRNKIKSKSYRKLERLRKEELREMAREELKQADPEIAVEWEEQQERDRVLERATQKHSKDSRHMMKLKKKGLAGQNPEVKKMLAERARVSKELTRKMNSVGLGVLGGSGDGEEEPEEGQNFFTFDVPEIEGDEGDSGKKGPRDDYDDTLAQEEAKEQVRMKQDEQQAKVSELLNSIPEAEAPSFAGATARIDKKSLGLSVSGNVTVSGILSDAVAPGDSQKQDLDSENPWLAVPSEAGRGKNSKKKTPKASSLPDDDDDGIDVDVAVAHQEDDEEVNDSEEEEDDDGVVEEEDDDKNPDLLQRDETQARLVAEAFAADDDDLEAEIDAEKMADAEEQAGVDEEDPNKALPGWGSWTGEGVQESARARARREAREEAAAKARKAKIDETIAVRRDAALRHVIINEKLDKKILKYKLDQAPIGMSQEVYNRTIAIPVGKEWQSSSVHRELIEPAVTIRRGRVIEPMKAPQQVTSSGNTTFANKRRKPSFASAPEQPTSISNSRKRPNK